MKLHFDILRITRKNIIEDIKGLSLDQLNKTPEGMNNNIAWNLGHLVATQQLLVYGLSRNLFVVPKSIIVENKIGTGPEKIYSQEEIDTFCEYLLSNIDRMEKDYNEGVLNSDNFKTYTTSYNITLSSVEESIIFNNIHEGMHYGIIKMIMKLV